MFLKPMLKIDEVPTNDLALISQVAAVNWSDNIDPNLRYHSSKRRKSTFFQEKWPESTLDLSDVPESYVEDSLGPYQRFGINQPSGRAQLKWHHIPNIRYSRQKRRKSTFWIEKWSESTLDISDVPETYVETSWGPWQRLVPISQVAALNWSDTIYPNLG